MEEAFTVWVTGLPQSGKKTLGEGIARALEERGMQVEVIASGKLRESPLGRGLGFSKEDRDRNNRQHALAAKLLTRNGVVAVVTAVSPYRATRDAIRQSLGRFVEVWVSTPKEVCIERDQKGVWARALAGEIRSFTGVDDPYEEPLSPEVEVDLTELDPPTATAAVMQKLEALGYLG